MNFRASGGVCVLLLGLLSAAVMTPATLAQSSAPSAAPSATLGGAGSTAPQRRAGTAIQPLSSADLSTLKKVFAKVRPAVLRIEQCPPTNCLEPDGVGSGVLISKDGLALTAYHVVEGAKSLSAQTLDKKRYKVEVIGYDDQHDLALLRVNTPAGTPFLPLAAQGPKIGDPLLAVGNGDGLFLQAKTGRLIGLNADAGRADFPPGTLEMNAPLIPGDSGGPILNAQGEVEGVVSYIASGNRGRTLSSYAVPVTSADALLADLNRGVKRDAPVIGIGLGGMFSDLFMLDATDFKDLSQVLNLGETPGAFFTSVSPGSPAARAGLQPLELNSDHRRVSGDIVTEVDGKRIINFSEFQYAVRSHAPGDTVTLTVLRGGKTLKIKVTLVGRSTLQN